MKYVYTAVSDCLAHTLPTFAVSGQEGFRETGEHTFTHADGWTIKGVIHEDYFYWVNNFEATHPKFGWVRGDFETQVEAKSKRGFDHFFEHHAPEEWDYGDI